MKQVYKVIIEHPKMILTTFLVAFLISAFFRPMIEVDYDMNDYLPEESASTVALDVMEEEFGGGIPNARVLVKDVTIPQALEYKAQMETIDGVTAVTWLDDAVSIEVPLETLDTATVEDYYKDGNALFSVTIEDDKRISAVDDIRALIGEDNAMTGSAVSSAIATVSTEKEIAKIVLFAVIFVFIVLFITTTSWLEPIMIMVGLGIAVIINAGTNIIFGKISFVTNAAGNILQLAVSLDYSVFLLHRFNECRKHYPDAKEAMLEALSMSTSSILSSGLTTVIGFLALCLMKFQLGSDLGRALAKGVFISLITVFVFMPVLILVFHNWIDKLEHKPLLPSFQKFGKVVTKIMFPMVILFLFVLVPSNLASNSNSFYYGSSNIFGTNTQLGRDTQMIEDIFGKSDTYVLLVPKDDKSVQKELSDALHEISQVSGIISYVDTVGMEIPEEYLDKSDYDALCSEHYTRMVLSLDTEYEGEKTFALVKEIRDTAEKYYPGEWYLAGEGVSTYDLMDTFSTDMVRVNFVAIAAVFVVLLLTLHSLVLPVILVLGIETAIWVNLSFPYFMDKTVFYIAYLIISSVQLGATVDYAILLTDRYKEFRQTMQKKDSVIQTISSVTVSILTSGSVLAVVGFLLGMFSSHGILSQLGFFIGRGSLCSLVIVLFALPGLLYIFDKTFIKRK